MCLMDTSNNSLARRLFRILITLKSQRRQCVLDDSLANCECSRAYIVINKDIVDRVCKEL